MKTFETIENEVIIAFAAAYASVAKTKRMEAVRKKRRTAKFWVNPYLRERETKGRFATDFEYMKANPTLFYENFHMDENTFEIIFNLVKPYLLPKRRTRRDLIEPKLKLAVVLEYLATGSIPMHMASKYRISKSHMGVLIDVVCDALSDALKNYISKPKEHDFIRIANGFMENWNFPNCIGAIGGRHIALKSAKSGSLFYDNNDNRSIELFAAADHEYKFIFLDIGAHGNDGDANIFAKSYFGNAVMEETLDFPETASVGSCKIPYFFIGDDAFPLSRRILKPFGGKNKLSNEEIIFNYRLNRARGCVENAFGILCSRWLCLKRTLFCKPDRARKISAACCLLHNFLLTETNTYSPRHYGDWVSDDGTVTEGEWRSTEILMSECTMFHSGLDGHRGRQNEAGKRIRDFLKDHVNSAEGALEGQRKAVKLNHDFESIFI